MTTPTTQSPRYLLRLFNPDDDSEFWLGTPKRWYRSRTDPLKWDVHESRESAKLFTSAREAAKYRTATAVKRLGSHFRWEVIEVSAGADRVVKSSRSRDRRAPREVQVRSLFANPLPEITAISQDHSSGEDSYYYYRIDNDWQKDICIARKLEKPSASHLEEIAKSIDGPVYRDFYVGGVDEGLGSAEERAALEDKLSDALLAVTESGMPAVRTWRDVHRLIAEVTGRIVVADDGGEVLAAPLPQADWEALDEEKIVAKLAHELLRRDLDWGVRGHKDMIREAVKTTNPPRGRKNSRLEDVVGEMDDQYDTRRKRFDMQKLPTPLTRKHERVARIAVQHLPEGTNAAAFARFDGVRLFAVRYPAALLIVQPDGSVHRLTQGLDSSAVQSVHAALMRLLTQADLSELLHGRGRFDFDFRNMQTVFSYPNGVSRVKRWKVECLRSAASS